MAKAICTHNPLKNAEEVGSLIIGTPFLYQGELYIRDGMVGDKGIGVARFYRLTGEKCANDSAGFENNTMPPSTLVQRVLITKILYEFK
jgi:hypothetical protein